MALTHSGCSFGSAATMRRCAQARQLIDGEAAALKAELKLDGASAADYIKSWDDVNTRLIYCPSLQRYVPAVAP